MAYHEGSVVPMLGLRVHQRPSGLLVVGDAEGPAPVDQMAVYLTAHEVFSHYLTQAVLDELLAGATASRLVWATASMLRVLHDDVSGVEEALIGEVLAGGALDRARNLLRRSERRLIAPQLQLLVSAGAVLALPWHEGDAPAESPDLVGALVLGLHVGDLLEGATHDETSEVLFGNVRAGLAADIVANQLLNSTSQLRADIARHEAVWHHHAPAVARDEGLPQLERVFQDATGVPLNVYEAIGFGLYAARSQPPFIPTSWFSSTYIEDEHLSRVAEMVSATPEQLRDQLARDIDGDLAANRWALQAFSRWPLLRFDESRWLVHSPQLLVDRFFSGLAFFDAWSAANEERERVWHAWGLATERYGHEVLQSVAGDRVYREDQLMRSYGTSGRRTADAAVDYGHRWLILDFSSRRPAQQLARGASPAALRHEVEVLIDDKARQLQDTIEAVRSNEAALTGTEQGSIPPRFTPAIVVHSRWPTNPITSELIRLRLDDLSLLQEDDVDALEVLTIEELEMVEAIQEQGGPDLITLLDRKREGSLRRMGLKDHILLVERLEVGMSKRLGDLFEACTDRIIHSFGFPDMGEWE